MAGAQGTRKTKKKTSDTLEGYVPPPTTTTTTPTETSWVSPPASLNTPFVASKKPTSVFTTPTTYTTPSQPTFSTNSFNPSLYSTNIYSQLASVDSLATADAKTIQNQKFLRGQAATQARTELQQAKLEAAETQQIPDRLSEPRTIVSDFDRTRGQAQKMTFVDPVQERVDSTNMGGFWGGDPMVQKAPTSDLEMQLNLALSSVRIDDSQKRIDDYQTQMARLQHTMESEEAKMRTKPQRRGFSGYSESFFMNESALWRDAKHEKDELEKIIGKEKTHLATEINKKEDWENISLTDVTGAAFTGGIDVGVGAPNPMEGAFDEITPTTLGTTTWVDKEPDINEVLQKPKVKTGKATSVFQGLELPQHDFLGGLGFNAINPLPALFGATVPASEVEKFREAEQAGGAGLWQTAYAEDGTEGSQDGTEGSPYPVESMAHTSIPEPTNVSMMGSTSGVDVGQAFGDEGLSDSKTSFAESRTYVTDDMGTPDDPSDDVHRMMGTPHLEGSIRDGIIGSIDDRPRIEDRYGTVVDNPDYMKFIYPVPSKEESATNQKDGKIWNRLTGWVEDEYIYKQGTMEIIGKKDPKDAHIFPDQTKLNPDGSKGTKAPDGYEWNQPFWDEKNANAPVMYNSQGEDIKGVFTVDQYGKEMYVYPTKGSELFHDDMGTPMDSSDDRTIRIPKNLSVEERQIIAKGYQQQAENRRLNELQREKFDAIRDGSISVQSFINMQTGGDKKLITDYFAERDVELHHSMASVKLVEDGFEPVEGIDVAAKWGTVDKTGYQASGLHQAVLLEYNNERGKIALDTTPEAQKYFIMPSDPVQSDYPEFDTRYQGVEPATMLDTRETIVDERKQVGTLAGGVLDLNEKIKNPNYGKQDSAGVIDTRKQIDNPNYNLWIDNPAYGTFIDNPTFDQQVPNPNAGQTMKEVEPLYAVDKDDVLDKIRELTEDGRMDGGWYLHPAREDPSVDMSVFHTDEELKELKERGVDVSSYQQTEPNEENYVSPEGFSPASVDKMWTLKEAYAESYGEAGSPAAIYLQPTTLLEAYNKRTGVTIPFSGVSFSTTNTDADKAMESFTDKDMESDESAALWNQIREREYSTTSDADWAKWIASKPEDTSEDWGDFMGFAPTEFPSPDDYEVRKTTGYEWTHEGIVHLESEGLIETKLEAKLRQADIKAQQRIDEPELFSVEPIDERSVMYPWKTGEVTSTPQIPDDAVAWGADGVPFQIIPSAFAERGDTITPTITTPDGGTLPVQVYPWSAVGLGGGGVPVGRSEVVSETPPVISGDSVIEAPAALSMTTVFEPTPQKKREGEYRVFYNNPLTYLAGMDLKWTQKGADAKADGTLAKLPNMSYSDLVDRGYVLREGLQDETRYFMSRDLQVFGNIIKAGAQVGGGEDYKIYEMTFLEKSLDAASKAIQWQMGQRVEDIDAKGGEIDPHTGELTKGFDERLGRPLTESASMISAGLEDEAQRYGSRYEQVQDPVTGIWTERLVGEESKGFLNAPGWYQDEGMGFAAEAPAIDLNKFNAGIGTVYTDPHSAGKDQPNLRALPWGTIAEIPAEAAFFAMGLPLKAAVATALKIVPYVTSKTAAAFLSKTIVKKAEAAFTAQSLKAKQAEMQTLESQAEWKGKEGVQEAPHGIPEQLAPKITKVPEPDMDLITKAKIIESEAPNIKWKRPDGTLDEHIRTPGVSTFEQTLAETAKKMPKEADSLLGTPRQPTAEAIKTAAKIQYKSTAETLYDVPFTRGQKAVQVGAKIAGMTPDKFMKTLSGAIHPNLGIKQGMVYSVSPLFKRWTGFIKSQPGFFQDTRVGRRMATIGTHPEARAVYDVLLMLSDNPKMQLLKAEGKDVDIAQIRKAMNEEDKKLFTDIEFELALDPKAVKDAIAKKLFPDSQKGVEVTYDTVGFGRSRSERATMRAEIDKVYKQNMKEANLPDVEEVLAGKEFALPASRSVREAMPEGMEDWTLRGKKGVPIGRGDTGGEVMVDVDRTRIDPLFAAPEFSSGSPIRAAGWQVEMFGESYLSKGGYGEATRPLLPKSWANLVKSDAYKEAEKLVKAGKVVWDDVGGYTVLAGKKISPTSQAAIKEATGLRKKATMIGETAEERAKYRLEEIGDSAPEWYDVKELGIKQVPSGLVKPPFEPVTFKAGVLGGTFVGKPVTRETLEESMGRVKWGVQESAPKSPQLVEGYRIAKRTGEIKQELKRFEQQDWLGKKTSGGQKHKDDLTDELSMLQGEWYALMQKRGYKGKITLLSHGEARSKKHGAIWDIELNLTRPDRPYTAEEITASQKMYKEALQRAKDAGEEVDDVSRTPQPFEKGDIKTGLPYPEVRIRKAGRRPEEIHFVRYIDDAGTMESLSRIGDSGTFQITGVSGKEVKKMMSMVDDTQKAEKGIFYDEGEGLVRWSKTSEHPAVERWMKEHGLSDFEEDVYFRFTHPKKQQKVAGVGFEGVPGTTKFEGKLTGKRAFTEVTKKDLKKADPEDKFDLTVIVGESKTLKKASGTDLQQLRRIFMGDPFFSTTTGLGKDFGVVLPSRGVVDDSTKSLESAIGVFQRLKEQGVTDPLTHMKEVEGYDIAGKPWFSKGVGYALTKLERENQQKLGHLDIFFDRKYDGVKLKPERESDMYYETRTTEQIFESTTNTTVKGLEQYDTHYLKNSIRAKEIWDTIGTEKMNELGFKMNSVGHIVLKADPTQKEGVIAKKIEKLLDTHRHATHQERDAPRAYLANISSDAGDDFVRESYSYELTELQTRYLKKHNLIASLDELRKFDDPDMKGQRRVLTDYFGAPRGEMIGTTTGGPNTFSFIPTSAGESANVNLISDNLYLIVKEARRKFIQPKWGKTQAERKLDPFNVKEANIPLKAELEAFLTADNLQIYKAFSSRFRMMKKTADREVIDDVTAKYKVNIVLEDMLKKAQGNFDSLDAESKGMRAMLPILDEMEKDMPRIYSSLLAVRLSDFTQRSTGKVGDRTRAHEMWKWHEEGMNIADKKQDDARNLIGFYKTKISDSKVMVKTLRFPDSKFKAVDISYRDPKKGEKTYQAWVDANKGLKKAEKDEKDATREYAINRDLAEKEQKSFERLQKAGLAAQDPSALMDEALMELDNYKIKYTFEGEEMVDGAPKVTALSWVVNEEAIATKKANFWTGKKWTGDYAKAVERRDEILDEFDGTGGKPNLNQMFPSTEEINIANKEHGNVHKELVKIRSQIMQTDNVSLFAKRDLAGAPLQQTDYAIQKFATQQKAMQAYFSIFGNKYTYQIAVKKGDKYSWVNLGKGAQTHIIERAKKHGVHLSDDDVAFAKELDTLPTGSKSLLPSEVNKIKREPLTTGNFDPDNVYATAPSGVLTVTDSTIKSQVASAYLPAGGVASVRGGIKRQVREGGPWDVGGVFRGGNWQGSVNYLPTGIAKDIQRMVRSQPPMSSSQAGRILEAMQLGKAELGVFSEKTRKAAEVLYPDMTKAGYSIKSGVTRDKDRLIIELQDNQKKTGGRISSLEKSITAKELAIQQLDEKAKVVNIREVDGLGKRLRKQLFALEVKKDAAWGKEGTTTKQFDTKDSGFVGVNYSSPNFKKIAKIQTEIDKVKDEMRSEGFLVPDYSIHMDEFWKAHRKIAKNETLSPAEQAVRDKGIIPQDEIGYNPTSFNQKIKNRDVHDYFAGDRRLLEDQKFKLETEYYQAKKAREIIDEALSENTAQKHIFQLQEWTPSARTKLQKHTEKMEGAQKKVENIEEQITEAKAKWAADAQALDVEQKLLEAGTYQQKVIMQGAEMGRYVVIPLEDAKRSPQLFRQFMEGKEWGAKDLLSGYTQTQLFSPKFGWMNYMPLEGLSKGSFGKGTLTPNELMTDGADSLSGGGLGAKLLRQSDMDEPLEELFVRPIKGIKEMTLEELDRAAIAKFNKPYKQLSNADKKTLKELDQKKREAQLDYALRVRQVRPEIPDDLMKDLIYKVYRSKVKLSPTGRWIEGQVAPIRGGLNELRLRLTGQAYIKGKTAGKGKKKHDVEGDYFTGRGGQYYGQYSAAQMGVTKYHIRKIEREMGISFEGQSKKVIELLEAGAIKGRKHGDVEAKVDSSLWTKLTPEQQIAYEQTGIYPTGSWQRIWTDAIEQRTLGERINKRLLDSEVVKRDGGVLQLPDHLVTNQTRLVRAKIWKEKLFDEFERHGLRKKAGERPETATEATNDILNKYTRMKQAEMSFEERGRLVQKAEAQLWNLGDRRTETNKAIPTGSLKRKDVDGTTFWNPPRLQETYFNPFHQDNEFGFGKYVTRGQLAEILKKQKDLLQGDKDHVFNMTEIYERTAHLNPTDYGAFLVSTWRMTDAQKKQFFGSVKEANKIVEFAHKKGIKDKDWQSAKKKIDDDRAKSDSAQKMVEPEERVDDSVGKSSDQEQKKAAREQYENTIDKMNEGMQFKMSEFFPYYDWVRYPATTGLPFRTPQPQETFNPFANEAFASPEFQGITPTPPSSQPTVTPQQPDLGVYGGLDPFKSKTPDFVPPDLTYSSGVSPISMPDITSGMDLAARSIQSDMSSLGVVSRIDQTMASRLVQSQTVAQKLTQMQIQRQQMVQKTRQQFRMKPMTRLATEPFVPRTVPRPPTFPMFFPPFDTMRPRRKPKKKIKKDKTRIWWDVPSQPLGEAWAANEYVVFKGKVEPAKVQKKERKKKLDYHETFVEPQEYTESFYSDKGAKNFGEV